MHKGAAKLLSAAALAAALSLAACGREEPAADNPMANADPALTSALEDQILVDPALTQQSNRNAVRPPETPTQAQYPVTDEPPTAAGAGCAEAVKPGEAWARRLPEAFAVYPGSRVTEAAGSDRPGCRVRIVTFASATPAERVIEHYRARAVGAGYTAEARARQGDRILQGTHKAGGAYYLILTPRVGSSEAALIVSEG
jgi:hypothetical protein